MTDIREEVRKYYSKITGEEDGIMETKICSCALDDLPKYVSEARALVPDEIVKHFYGCGSPIPAALECMTVLDLGCGFRVIIVIEANSYVNIRSSRLLPKFKTQKINSWCAA
uniref:hypothetical protein n=1 Tax=Ezakiella massiliensis TaxID=1852374 RepID=UPI001E426DC8|nr:hypothetical protein [Ezakiella massiliensis]